MNIMSFILADDECQNGTAHMCNVEAPADGRVDGECQDLLGSFECNCPDGYTFDSTQGGCTGKFIIIIAVIFAFDVIIIIIFNVVVVVVIVIIVAFIT